MGYRTHVIRTRRNTRLLHVVLAIILSTAVFLLPACSSNGGDDNSAAQSSTPVLAGDPAQTASAVLQDTDAGPVAPNDIVQGYLLTRLFVALTADATVGQVNAAATTVGATAIAFSASDSSLLTLQIPRKAGIGDLHQLADHLRAQPGIRFAYPAREFKASVLPERLGQPVSPVDLSHLLSTRFPQAWNARGAAASDCLPRSVDVYIADIFGDFNARPTFFNQFDRTSFFFDGIEAGFDNGHGFDVAMTLGAKFDDQKPTGANPFKDCLVIHEIEAFGRADYEVMERTLQAVKSEADSQFILNISMNFPDPLCGPNSDQVCDAQNIQTTTRQRLQFEIIHRAGLASQWARFITSQAPDLDQRMLITQSAGNVDPGPGGFLARTYIGFRDANFSSPAALATTLDRLGADLANPLNWHGDATSPDITFSTVEVQGAIAMATPPTGFRAKNLLVVESATDAEAFADVRGSAFNFIVPGGRFAHISAVGENITLPDAPAVPIESQEGTSFAAPQVAGLASYLWVLDDGLRNQPVEETLKLIDATSRFNDHVAVIDAYGAVLALDARNGNKRIRTALLDANDDGVFDHLDLVKFQEAYKLTDPNRPTIPSARDYSRFDLNGDGFTGGIIIAPFDLNADGLATNAIPLINTIEGFPITFNEAALSDIQILCFYAYSDLYQAGQQNDPRSDILGSDHCVGVRMNALLPPQISTSASLNVTVEVPAANGQFAPAPNLLVEFTPTCSTVSPPSGRTDANGALSTTVTPNTGCTSVSVNAVTRADVGATPLAQTTVGATVTPSGVTRVTSRGVATVVPVVPGPSNSSICTPDFPNLVTSPEGATESTISISCTAEDGSFGTASTFFRETYDGGNLVAVTASGSTSFTATGPLCSSGTIGASGAYSFFQLDFDVAAPTSLSINAQINGNVPVKPVVFLEGLINDTSGSPINQTFTLTPGKRTLFINVGVCDGENGSSGSASFQLDLTFGP